METLRTHGCLLGETVPGEKGSAATMQADPQLAAAACLWATASTSLFSESDKKTLLIRSYCHDDDDPMNHQMK